jgi:3-oxoacyl-[acyl-carrier-protein] synthase-3
VVTNQELAERVDTSDEWIATRTGIRQRHVAADGETTCDLAFHAATRAMEAAGVAAGELDLIVVGTTTPDLIFPSTACLLQARLGANGCPAFDVNAACSGFVYALSVADKFIRSGSARTVLVVGAETLTRMLDWTDRSTCVLFGDGAGAVVLKADADTGILSTHMHADGAKKELLWNPVGVSAGFKPEEHNAGVRVLMTGNEVFKHAVKALDSVVEETLEANGLDRHDIDWLIPHQANLRIIEATAKRLDMPMERVVVTVDRHGNTSSGSVPLALDEAVRSGRVQRGQLLLLEAFGGGFTWGSALLRY